MVIVRVANCNLDPLPFKSRLTFFLPSDTSSQERSGGYDRGSSISSQRICFFKITFQITIILFLTFPYVQYSHRSDWKDFIEFPLCPAREKIVEVPIEVPMLLQYPLPFKSRLPFFFPSDMSS